MTEPTNPSPRGGLDGRIIGGAFAAWLIVGVVFGLLVGGGSDWPIGIGIAGVVAGGVLLLVALVQFVRPSQQNGPSFLLAALLIGVIGYGTCMTFFQW